MSDQWSSNPGGAPPTPPSVPAGWNVSTAPTRPPGYGAGPPLPPLPQPYERKPPSRAALIIASMALVILILAAGLAFVAFRRSDQPTATAPSTTTSSSSTTTTKKPTTTTVPTRPSTPTTPSVPRTPPTTVPVGPPPTQAEVEAAVAEISAFVAKERGLPFKTPVKVELVGDDDFNARLLKDFDKDEAIIERDGKVLKALGLIDPGLDVAETMKSLLSAGVLGFYDPETKALVVRGHAITPYIKQTISHELTHALDDQYFDLNRKDLDDKKDESLFGFQATVEGNARRVESAYVNAMSPADKQSRDEEEASFASAQAGVLSALPPILINIISAPYDYGQPFVTATVAQGGNDLLASALTTPPLTSAQVLHPQKFFTHVAPVAVPKPKADGKELDDRMFGELMTTLTLDDGAPSEAAKAADGWAGDWYVLWDDGQNGSCVRIDYTMAGSKDLDELEHAFKTWQQKHKGAQIQRSADGLEVTSCSSAASGGGRSPA